MLTLRSIYPNTIFILCCTTFAWQAQAQTTGDYRSLAGGVWATATNWEMYNGTAWVTAGAAPNNTNGIITIQSGHTMQINANLNIDQVTIDAGGTINWTAGTLTISNGTGVDLQVNGTFIDAVNTAITGWGTAGPTWALGANGTYIKRSSNSSNNWRDRYQGGIAGIPATANWIIEKNSTTNPVVTTTGGMHYPNLTIVNNTAGNWNTAAASTFNGTTDYPRIKGSFTIGGPATTGTVNFLTNVTFATPISVGGNLTVYAGNALRNYGTGFTVNGDITVSGSVEYDLNDNRLVSLTGAGNQFINATGTFDIYNLTVNKTGGTVTLNNAIEVDNVLTLTNGIVYTSAPNLLTVNTNGSVSGGSNASFIDGPIRYKGLNAFTFPVGKGADHQAIGVSASPAPITFWTETFDGTVCPASSGCDPSMVAWTTTSLGGEGATANVFYVSCAENGNAAGVCGAGCGSDQSLHVGNVPGSAAAAFFCGGGDCGAAFDDSGPGERTNKRAESPAINCTGFSNITVSFNYIEQGGSTDDAGDDASFWYFDGLTWVLFDNMPSTVNTGCGGQGRWTAYTVTLPASADNNPNVRIGFGWVNDGDGAASDPSFAVDDISVTSSAVSDFTAEYFHTNPQVPYGNLLASPLSSLSSCEYWILTRNAGTESKTVTLNWDANSCPVTSLSTIRVARHDGVSTWQNEGNTGTTGTTAAGTITSALVTNFSPFTIADVTVLPIEMLYFDANYNGTYVELKWITAAEINNDYFTAERSVNGIDFYPVGHVRGAGNSNATHNYILPDYGPAKGINYYRIKQTDFNGSYTYSNTDVVELKAGEGLHLNQVSLQNANVQFYFSQPANTSSSIAIYDMSGRLIVSQPCASETMHQVNKSLMAPGIYTVLLTNGNLSDRRKFNVD